jgi:[acyl-carrier-protein] S-malonyltransferase
MRPAAERLAQDLALVPFGEMSMTIISNVTAEPVAHLGNAAGLLERQVTSPVRWTESLLKLHELGVRRFLEFGSGRVLSGLVGRTLEGADARAVTDAASLKEAL